TSLEDGIASPILLGDESVIKGKLKAIGIKPDRMTIIDPSQARTSETYINEFYKVRERKGMTLRQAKTLLKQPNYFGSMMVKLGHADALISGLTTSYPETIRPALQCLGVKEGLNVASGLYIVVTKKDVYFFADTTVNVNPTAEQLAEIAISTADTVKRFDIEPRVAMLSFSNFGSAPMPESLKVKRAVEIVKQLRPDIIIDGEMQADTAVVPQIRENDYPFTTLKGKANVLVFPDLNSGNIAYKLMARIGNAEVIGPVLMGISKPVHVLQRGASVEDIINMTAIAVVEAGQK
ncbi:MAG TPA: phosphate acyltransferase, partial [Ignavibacteriales bacterium]|nr:phosphate acyltransferase [Ignavibacteriales bacterium]